MNTAILALMIIGGVLLLATTAVVLMWLFGGAGLVLLFVGVPALGMYVAGRKDRPANSGRSTTIDERYL